MYGSALKKRTDPGRKERSDSPNPEKTYIFVPDDLQKHTCMKKIGIFYGPEKGSVERTAQLLADMIGPEKTDLWLVKESKASDVEQYENIIFGISTVGRETWEAEGPDADWDHFLPEIDQVDWSGKTVALYGLGDHIAYADYFVDALGVLANRLLENGAKIVGRVSPEGYTFTSSKGIIDGEFIGLPLDEDYESDKTPGRLGNWLKKILPAFHA